jgi:pimeloyl-ACP methyl ester carboxylesterase
MIPAGAGSVELVVMAADSSVWPAPGVLVVPSPGTSARSMLRWALSVNQRGFSVGIVSLPGSGRSTGSDDRAGPASVAAVEAALSRFVREPGVNARRIALWGIRDAAPSALLAAVKHPELAGIISEDAHYDPWAAYRELSASERAAFVLAAGRDSAAWRARSPLAAAARIAAPVLVVQSDEVESPAATGAEAFAAARAEKQLFIEARINAVEGRPIRHRDATRVAFDFLSRRLRQP